MVEETAAPKVYKKTVPVIQPTKPSASKKEELPVEKTDAPQLSVGTTSGANAHVAPVPAPQKTTAAVAASVAPASEHSDITADNIVRWVRIHQVKNAKAGFNDGDKPDFLELYLERGIVIRVEGKITVG